MYTPKYYKIEDEKIIYDIINKNSFGILVSTNEGKITATHIPILLEQNKEGIYHLFGHISAGNLQWKDAGEDVLAIFHGPHQYISSSWYETNESVPTWNYVSVHVYGKIKFIKEREYMTEVLKKTINFFEEENSGYSLENVPHEYFEKLLKGIIAFEIQIERMEGKWKLSQNHTPERQKRVIDALETQGDDNSLAIAGMMKKNLNSDGKS